MIIAQKPKNEKSRIKALKSLNILDSLPEYQYDNITELASFICDTKNAVISLVDENRQWFKSRLGIAVCETPRGISFCAHAIHNPKELMEIPNTHDDPRFKDNPLVHDKDNPVIFYAGVPILDESGYALGTLCVFDDKSKKLNEQQKKSLKNLAEQVQELLKLHARNTELEESRTGLKKHNDLLKDFAGTVSHDMKMPLANLIITSDILQKKYSEIIDETGKQYLSYLKKSSLSLSDYITNILAHYESSSYDVDDRSSFNVNDLLENIIELINIKHHCVINLPEFNQSIHCNRVALEQIFLNLIGNSIKYNDKEETIIDISIALDDSHYTFKVSDNGRGIPEDKLESVFDLFSTLGEYDREGQKGHGIGLSTVQKLVEKLDGAISVDSQLGEKTTFTFSIAQ
jgi:signal transduction histidine kinase